MARGRAWLFCAIAMLLAVVAAGGWGTFVSLRISDRPGPWPAGQVWNNQAQGTSFQILKVTQTTEVKTGSSSSKKAPAGSVYLLWQIKATGITEENKKRFDGFVYCSFDLIGTKQAKWTNDVTATPDGAVATCSDEVFHANGEGVLTATYLVPEDRLDDVLGVQLSHPMQIKQPPLLTRP